jgi:FkbM family methyltransferase
MGEYYIRIKGDIFVTTLPTIEHISTWVLLEQEDWFEKEIKFIRRLLQPGMHAIDVGANHGVYALTMAKLVAPQGQVWAFEPAPETAAMLRQSIERNQLPHLRLLQVALSDHVGTATLRLNSESELNSLVHDYGARRAGTAEVAVSTLDQQQAELNWGPIDFIKIDAEGSCLSILAGGEQFFAAQSPLVMFEIDDTIAGTDKLTLPAAFRERGYDIYRLIGPDLLLVPLRTDEKVEAFEVNLFACKPDRAEALAAAGLLVLQDRAPPLIPEGGGLAFYQRQIYAVVFGVLGFSDPTYCRAFDAYALWRDETAAPSLRCAALAAALTAAQEAVQEKPSIARLSTLARIAVEAGERQLAIDTLWRVLFESETKPPEEPFLPPAQRYEAIFPGNFAREWFVAANIEAWEESRCFSGCFVPADAQRLDMLDWVQGTPFASARMERRRQLQRMIIGLQSGFTATPILLQAAPDHLNPEIWTSG